MSNIKKTKTYEIIFRYTDIGNLSIPQFVVSEKTEGVLNDTVYYCNIIIFNESLGEYLVDIGDYEYLILIKNNIFKLCYDENKCNKFLCEEEGIITKFIDIRKSTRSINWCGYNT